jgi:tRNA threonylcarbamoyladenosine biosynthesis protein TsaB
MKTILAIETSTRTSSVALWRGNQLAYDSEFEPVASDGFDLAALVTRALAAAKIEAGDINLIAVDAGPGGLNAVRAGVTFANGLALSLGIPIVALSSLAIMGFQAQAATGLPVVCLRGASTDNALMALYDAGRVGEQFRGTLSALAERARELRSPHAFAGRYREQMIEQLGRPDLATDSGVDRPTAAGLLAALAAQGPALVPDSAPVQILYPENGIRGLP